MKPADNLDCRAGAAPTRSSTHLRAGIRALEQHDTDRAAIYLAQLERDGRPEDFRVLSLAMLREAA